MNGSYGQWKRGANSAAEVFEYPMVEGDVGPSGLPNFVSCNRDAVERRARELHEKAERIERGRRKVAEFLAK